MSETPRRQIPTLPEASELEPDDRLLLRQGIEDRQLPASIILNGIEDSIGAVIVDGDDPGSVGQFRLWMDTSGANPRLRQRNAANNGWVDVAEHEDGEWRPFISGETQQVGTQSNHNAPSGVEKLAQLDRLEAAGWIGAGKVLQRVTAARETGASTTSTSFGDIGGTAVSITPIKSDSIIFVRAFIPHTELEPASGTQATMRSVYRVWNSTDEVGGVQSRNGGVFSEPTETNRFTFSASCEMRHQVTDLSQKQFNLQWRSASSNTRRTLEVSEDIAATLEAVEIAQ